MSDSVLPESGLATDKGWLDAAALSALEAQLAARPSGHDHGSPATV
jgi:hypothetical protein